jgi:hypothetical protein
VDRYREALARLPIDVLQFEITRQASLVDVQRVRPHLARPFRGISDEDLACLGFWLVFRKRGG